MATASRSDPGEGVAGFAIVLLTVVFSAIGLPIPSLAYFLLIGLGTVLAVRSAGMTGFGLGALVLAAVILAMPLVTRVIAGSPSPDLEEPIPVPSGYGLVLEPSTNAMHLYASTTLVGDTEAITKAQQAVLDYYVKRLQDLGWTVVSLGDSAELKAPDSDMGILVMTYRGVPDWGNQAGTLIVQIEPRLCPDDESSCLPARIYDLKPYTGAARDLQATPASPTVDDTTRQQEDGGYILTPHDKEYVDYTWDRLTKAQRRYICGLIADGVSDAEMEEWMGGVEEEGIPVTEEAEANSRARFEYMAATYC